MSVLLLGALPDFGSFLAGRGWRGGAFELVHRFVQFSIIRVFTNVAMILCPSLAQIYHRTFDHLDSLLGLRIPVSFGASTQSQRFFVSLVVRCLLFGLEVEQVGPQRHTTFLSLLARPQVEWRKVALLQLEERVSELGSRC